MADKKYKIKVEGQEIDIPAEVGILEDADLKCALTPMFPGAANSRIEWSEKDDAVTITVIKMAGSKGGGRRPSNSKKGGGLAALLNCKSRRNPAVELYIQLHEKDVNELDPDSLIACSDEIEKALEAGVKQHQSLGAAFGRLVRASPKEGTDFVPIGF